MTDYREKNPKRSTALSISESFQPFQLNYESAGFTSDYYSFHTMKRQRDWNEKKYITKQEISKSHSETVNITEDTTDKLKNYKRISCYTIGYQYDLKIVNDFFKQINLIPEKTNLLKNVIIINFLPPNSEKFVFIFDYGVVVMWSFEEEEEKRIFQAFLKCCKYVINTNYLKNDSHNFISHSESLRYTDQENVFFYIKGETFSMSQKNKIVIESSDLDERLSITYALAQETILNHYENEVSNAIEETKKIPIEMRDKGEIKLTKQEISRNIGLIFMRRSAVNLNSDILDTPDIFWEKSHRDESELYYIYIRKFLDIEKRVEILNKRMKILKELYDVLNNEVKTQGKFRLEWIVVYLIVIEIFVSLFWKILVKDILKLF
jgi:uncharacterized Rmd1/YagE family protein